MADGAATESAGTNTKPVVYSRSTIPGDEILPPATLAGWQRLVYLAIYALAVTVSFAGIAYALLTNPALAVFGGIAAYLINNYLFSIVHVRYHSSFIELPESKMEMLLHNAFIHHYRDIGAFHKNWLESRISYFVDPSGINGSIVATMVFIPLVISSFLWTYEPALGVTYLATIWAIQLLQGTIHEWYHCPTRKRLEHFTSPVHYFFVFLEKIGIASRRTHAYHHEHQLDNLHEVRFWLDLRVPFGEVLPSYLWKKMLTRYRPGQVRMVPVTRVVGFIMYVSLQGLLTYSYITLFT